MYEGMSRVSLDFVTDKMRESLMIRNQEYYKKLSLGLSTRGILPEIPLYETDECFMYFPRMLGDVVRKNGAVNYDTPISEGQRVKFKYTLVPRKDQVPAIKALVGTDGGILEAGCGKGKTVMAIDAMTRVGVTTLVLVHKDFLMTQWKERIKEFTGEEAGTIQGKICDYEGRKVVVGMIQSLINPEKYPKEMFSYFGLVITDEVHRVGSNEWSKVIRSFPAKKRWGLTATPKRSDHMEGMFKAHIGDIVYMLSGENLTPRVAFIETPSTVNICDILNRYTGLVNIPSLHTVLSKDKVRNKQVLAVLDNALKNERKVLILGDRVEQLEEMVKVCNRNYKGNPAILYVGKTPQAERERAREDSVRAIFGTTSLAKEGLDIPSLDTLMLISPNSSDGTIQQATGRILRACDNKKEPIIIDFYDKNIGVCKSMMERRKRLYARLNYRL